MRMSATFMIVYAIDSRESFEQAQDVCKRLAQLRDTTALKCCVLLGNKLDLVESGGARAVSFAEAAALAEQYSMRHFEASAKTGAGVTEAFVACVRLFSEARMADSEQ